VAVRRNSVFATPVTARARKASGTDAVSVVGLNARTMKRVCKWIGAVPMAHPGIDYDFGAGPVTVPGRGQGTHNGSGGRHERERHLLCLAGGAPRARTGLEAPDRRSRHTLDPRRRLESAEALWIAGNTTTIRGHDIQGVGSQLHRSRQVPVGARLSAAVLGTPSLNSSNLLGVAAYDSIKGCPDR
jgi:hypothetical protein